MLEDIRRIEDTYGPYETYSWNRQFMDIEQYNIFLEETVSAVLYSLCAVFVVVGFITVNLTVTLLVVFSVILVDFYLVALIHFWGLTMNSFTGVNLIFSLGLAVDYSSHIAHNFLLTQPPEHCITNR